MTALPASGDVLGTPAPVLSPDLVTALVRETWGLRAVTVRPLTSERDLNILVDGRYVLKVSNPAEDPAVVDMENTAMAHAARVAPGLPLPAVIRTAAGLSVVGIADDADKACLARLVTVVPGSPAEGRPVSTELASQIGALAARTSLALQGLFHRAGDRVLDWDIRRAHQVLGEPGRLGAFGVLGPRIAGLLPRLADAADATAALPAGLNHADVTLTNILTDGRSRITGLVDFGDLHHTAHACDLAVALTSVLRNTAGQQPAPAWRSHPVPISPMRSRKTCSGAAARSPAARSARCSTHGRCTSSAVMARGCSPPTAPGTSTPTTTSPSSGTPTPPWRRR